MTILSWEYARAVWEQCDKHESYDTFGRQLFTEIATRHMEEEHFGKGQGIQAVVENNREYAGAYPYDYCAGTLDEEQSPPRVQED